MQKTEKEQKYQAILEDNFEQDSINQTLPREGLDALGTTAACSLAFISLSKNLLHAIPITETIFSGMALTAAMYDMYKNKDKGISGNAGNIGKSIVSLLTMAISFGLIFQFAAPLMIGLIAAITSVGLMTGAAELYNNKVGQNVKLAILNEKIKYNQKSKNPDPAVEYEIIEAQLSKKFHVAQSKANISAIFATVLTAVSMSLPFIFPATAFITIIELIALLVPATMLAIGSAKYAKDAYKLDKFIQKTQQLHQVCHKLLDPYEIKEFQIENDTILSEAGNQSILLPLKQTFAKLDIKAKSSPKEFTNNQERFSITNVSAIELKLQDGEIFLADINIDKYELQRIIQTYSDSEITISESLGSNRINQIQIQQATILSEAEQTNTTIEINTVPMKFELLEGKIIKEDEHIQTNEIEAELVGLGFMSGRVEFEQTPRFNSYDSYSKSTQLIFQPSNNNQKNKLFNSNYSKNIQYLKNRETADPQKVKPKLTEYEKNIMQYQQKSIAFLDLLKKHTAIKDSGKYKNICEDSIDRIKDKLQKSMDMLRGKKSFRARELSRRNNQNEGITI